MRTVSNARVIRIALLGFNRIELAALDAFFRFAARRSPAYAQAAEPLAADFLIVDAADAAACAVVREAGLLARTLAVGTPPLEGAMLQQPRPLNLMRIVRAFDEASARAAGPAASPQAGWEKGEGTTAAPLAGIDAPGRLRILGGQGVDSPPATLPQPQARKSRKPRELATTITMGLDTAFADTAPLTEAAARAAAPKAAHMDHILVVDDSEFTLRFMASHLQRFGFQIHLAQSMPEALKRLAERHFEFIFIDLMMRGLEGVALCKAIKSGLLHSGPHEPVVVMISSRAVDRLRSTMAGADACLSKPLREVELFKLLGEREVARHAYAETGIVSAV